MVATPAGCQPPRRQRGQGPRRCSTVSLGRTTGGGAGPHDVYDFRRRCNACVLRGRGAELEIIPPQQDNTEKTAMAAVAHDFWQELEDDQDVRIEGVID